MKGGVGKTTLTLGLASAAWNRHWRTLVVDLDPQANASMGVGLMASGQASAEQELTDLMWSPVFYRNAGFTKNWVPAYGLLGLWTLLLIGALAVFGTR